MIKFVFIAVIAFVPFWTEEVLAGYYNPDSNCICETYVCLEKENGGNFYVNGYRPHLHCNMLILKKSVLEADHVWSRIMFWEEFNQNAFPENFDCEKTPSRGNVCELFVEASKWCKDYKVRTTTKIMPQCP